MAETLKFMSHSQSSIPFIIIFLLSLAHLNLSAADIHDLLPKYGLPKGILPNVINSFTLADDGTFQVRLQHSCYVQFDQLVYYGELITGKIKYGSILDVSGIQAKKLFVWVPVTGMVADFDSDMIEFHVGILSKKFPTKQFESVPNCQKQGCDQMTIEQAEVI